MKYYKTESRRISFREYYNISHGSGFVVAWLYKLLGIPLKLTSGIPEPESFRALIIETQIVPFQILAPLNSGVLDLQKLGFDQFWFYTLKSSLIGGEAYGVQALHSSHKAIGKIIFASYKSQQNLVLVFVSEMNDGTFWGTTNNRPQFNTPPGYSVQRRLWADAKQLWELHQNKLAESNESNPAKTVRNFDEVVALEDKASRLSFEDKIARGIWVEMTNIEVEALRAKLSGR